MKIFIHNLNISELMFLHWKNAFNFHGKTSRNDFWIPFFIQLIPVFTTTGLAFNWNSYNLLIKLIILILYAYVLASIVPFASSMMRRLHDTGNSGFLMLSLLISPLCHLLLISICCMKSNDKAVPTISTYWEQILKKSSRNIDILKSMISTVNLFLPFLYSLYLMYSVLNDSTEVRSAINYAVYLLTQLYMVLQVLSWTHIGNSSANAKKLQKLYTLSKRFIIYPYVIIVFGNHSNGRGDIYSLTYGIFITLLIFIQLGKEIFTILAKIRANK